MGSFDFVFCIIFIIASSTYSWATKEAIDGDNRIGRALQHANEIVNRHNAVMMNRAHATHSHRIEIPALPKLAREEQEQSDVILRQLQRAVSKKDFGVVPIVYIVYSKIPEYLLYNIEVSRRTNRIVVVISDTFAQVSSDVHKHLPASKSLESSDIDAYYDMQPSIVFHVPMRDISQHRDDFHNNYISVGVEQQRVRYEYLCIERWIVFGNFMEVFKVDRAFFADSDVVLLASMSQAFQDRHKCDAVVIVENLAGCSRIQPLGAINGHSTLWTQRAVLDWRSFLIALYRDYKSSVTLSGVKLRPNIHNFKPNRICDMNLLWLYFASRTSHLPVGYATGGAYMISSTPSDAETLTNSVNAMYLWARTLPLPPLPDNGTSKIHLCNGLDIVDRTVFDHMWAYRLPTFSANLPPVADTSLHGRSELSKQLSSYLLDETSANGTSSLAQTIPTSGGKIAVVGDRRKESGAPYITGIASPSGGIPETLDAAEQERLNLKESPIYLLSIHYQGGDKYYIPGDDCRWLLLTYSPANLSKDSLSTHTKAHTEHGKLLPKGNIFDPFVLEDCQKWLNSPDQVLRERLYTGFPGPYNHNKDVPEFKIMV